MGLIHLHSVLFIWVIYFAAPTSNPGSKYRAAHNSLVMPIRPKTKRYHLKMLDR
jgi:hypothetical protein